MIAKTSIEAFNDLTKNGKLSRDCVRVFGVLMQSNDPLTDTEIASELGEDDPVNSKAYRPRRSELVEMGLVEQAGTKLSSFTGKQNITWRIRKDYVGASSQYNCMSPSEMKQIKTLLTKAKRYANTFQKTQIRSYF